MGEFLGVADDAVADALSVRSEPMSDLSVGSVFVRNQGRKDTTVGSLLTGQLSESCSKHAISRS